MREKIQSISDLEQIAAEYQAGMDKYVGQILVCSGAGCVSSHSADVKQAVVDELKELGRQDDILVRETGCMGTCAAGPVMLILPERTFYTKLTPETQNSS
jgi:NADH:ubiquinone oxidoreductase subunit E